MYDVIYADPPWRYSFSKSNSRAIENQYLTMTLQDICNLNVPSKSNCVCYLWATAPKLVEALQVLKAWGFDYKTNAVWDKVNFGMGYWFRGQHEILLVGTKGKVKPPVPAARRSSVFEIKRGRHSAKPDEVRQHIANCFPDAKRLELFARDKQSGWDVWGNEVNGVKLCNTK